MDDMTRSEAASNGRTSDAPPRPRPWRRRVGMVVGSLLVIALLVGGTLIWLANRHYESTDDAMVDANTTQVAPRVAGQGTELLFSDNQHVTQGQVLVRIDPRDYQAKLDQARAQEASARAA